MPVAINPPYLGAAYYPEDWPEQTIEEDLRFMKQANMNVMRIGEFAWSSMEPVEGQFEWGWLHKVIERLAQENIGTILCTPTATPPAWLTSKYPSVLAVDDMGVAAQHGARRHVCPNDPTYRRLCERIVTEMAKEFAEDPNVIGWQIDNEVNPHGPIGCACETCVQGYHAFLEKRFGTIQALNDELCMNLWSQTYDNFEQVPYPRTDTWHHPSLKALYAEYASDSLAEYIRVQGQTLKKYVRVPVGTDMMPTLRMDYMTSHDEMDLVQFNHYNSTENLWAVTFWYNYIRTLKPVPFWNTETSTGWNGSVTSNLMKPEGFCRVNSWLPIALGGEANLYWLWRSHWSGQELMHGSVISSAGRPLHMYDEVVEVGQGFQKCAEFLNNAPVAKPNVAVHFSSKSYFTLTAQPMANGLVYTEEIINHVYKPLMEAGYMVDMIDPSADLEGYSVVVSPFLPHVTSEAMAHIREFMEQGGTWIVGPLSDCRDENGSKYMESPFGALEELAGAYVRWQAPGDTLNWRIAWPFGETMGNLWYDAMEPTDGQTNVVASYVDGPFAGKAAALERRIGRGRIVVLGTWSEAALLPMLKRLDVLPPVCRAENVLAVPRKAEQDGLVVVEMYGKKGWLELPKPMHDLIQDKTYEAGMIQIAPYEVLCLTGA